MSGNQTFCGSCNRPMRPRESKAVDYPGTTTPGSRGLCHGCYYRRLRGHDGPAKSVRSVQATAEDVEWLIGTDSPESIAMRLGYAHLSHLLKTLNRANRRDLVERLTDQAAA